MSKREKDTNYDWIIAQLGPTHRLIECSDHIQWILQELSGDQWRNKKFLTSRDGVIRRTAGLPGAETLADLPARFRSRFMAQHGPTITA